MEHQGQNHSVTSDYVPVGDCSVVTARWGVGLKGRFFSSLCSCLVSPCWRMLLPASGWVPFLEGPVTLEQLQLVAGTLQGAKDAILQLQNHVNPGLINPQALGCLIGKVPFKWQIMTIEGIPP